MTITPDLFGAGFTVEDYVRNLRNYRSLVRDLVEAAGADPTHVRRLVDAASRKGQPVRATVMTEDWCGDAACNVPIIASLCDGAGIELRVFRGSEHLDLKRYYEESGDDHIPAVSFWDGSGAEIARWIEAPAAIHERKDAWKAQRPHFEDLYRRQTGGDKEAARAFAPLYRELLETMAGWYRDGAWSETTREIVERIEIGTGRD
jgi:hypothetical protein